MLHENRTRILPYFSLNDFGGIDFVSCNLYRVEINYQTEEYDDLDRLQERETLFVMAASLDGCIEQSRVILDNLRRYRIDDQEWNGVDFIKSIDISLVTTELHFSREVGQRLRSL